MNFFERVTKWLDRSEVSWVTLLTKVLPILVPIIPAIQTKYHVVSVLGYDEAFGWIAAVIVEFFGYAAMYKMIQFAFERGWALFILAVVIYFFYLGIIIAFNVIPEIEQNKPTYIIWMNALFSVMSVPAGALTAISALHTQVQERRRAEQEKQEAERKAENERRRAERQAERERRTEARTPQSNEQPNTRTPNTRTNAIPQPANERKFKPFPNTEQTDKGARIEQAARTLEAELRRTPSVREIQQKLREQDGVDAGWSTSTINTHLKREG